jgi:hypothetical protein
VLAVRTELLPPAEDYLLRDKLDEAYRRIEARHALSDVAHWLTSECGQEVSAEWLDGAFGPMDTVEAAQARISERPPDTPLTSAPNTSPTRPGAGW